MLTEYLHLACLLPYKFLVAWANHTHSGILDRVWQIWVHSCNSFHLQVYRHGASKDQISHHMSSYPFLPHPFAKIQTFFCLRSTILLLVDGNLFTILLSLLHILHLPLLSPRHHPFVPPCYLLLNLVVLTFHCPLALEIPPYLHSISHQVLLYRSWDSKVPEALQLFFTC